MSTSREVLRFDDLDPYLLLKNGNFLYKVPFREGWAVLKVYFGSRGPWSRFTKSVENVLLAGQTSYLPRTRRRVELECLHLWSRHGFRVYGTFEEVEVQAPNCPADGYLLFEFLEAPKLHHFLRDESIDIEERFRTYRVWLPEWSRRHDIAIADREPRLVHENGDGKHVLILGNDQFLWFDFEICYRSRSRVGDHVSHEIVQYIWNIMKMVPPEIRERVLAETVDHYPDRARLETAHDYFFNHPNPFHRWGRAFDRRFSKRAQKASSKYNIARKLHERLGSS